MANLEAVRLCAFQVCPFRWLLGGVQAVLLTMIVLKAGGIMRRKESFWIIFLRKCCVTVWLTVLASIALGFVISAIVKTGDKAMAIAPFVLIIQLLFSGISIYIGGSRKGDLLYNGQPLVGGSAWEVSQN